MSMQLRLIGPPPGELLSAHDTFRIVKAAAKGAACGEEIMIENIPATSALSVILSVEEDPAVGHRSLRASYNSLTRQLLLKPAVGMIHCSCQSWIYREHMKMLFSGWLNLQELDLLQMCPGTTVHAFNPPYVGSVKEPDMCWRIKGERIPSVIVEMGCSEAYQKRLCDMGLWVVGAAPQARIVIFIGLDRRAGCVASYVEVFRPTPTGNGYLIDPRIDIFPQPNPPHVKFIPITRGDLFGNCLFPGRNPGDVWNLDVGDLGEGVARGLRSEWRFLL